MRLQSPSPGDAPPPGTSHVPAAFQLVATKLPLTDTPVRMFDHPASPISLAPPVLRQMVADQNTDRTLRGASLFDGKHGMKLDTVVSHALLPMDAVKET